MNPGKAVSTTGTPFVAETDSTDRKLFLGDEQAVVEVRLPVNGVTVAASRRSSVTRFGLTAGAHTTVCVACPPYENIRGSILKVN